jgi:MFS superfamily sulfate permease-like transporter
MKREMFVFGLCMCFLAVCFGQEATHSIGDYLDKVGGLTTILAGVASTILTEVFNKFTGSTKTNGLIAAVCMAIAIGLVLIMFGVPSVSIASIFTVASGLFAIYRKAQQAFAK